MSDDGTFIAFLEVITLYKFFLDKYPTTLWRNLPQKCGEISLRNVEKFPSEMALFEKIHLFYSLPGPQILLIATMLIVNP